MDLYRYKDPREVAESERLFQRDLRALRVVDDQRDLRPTILRREDVDGVYVDPRASKAAGDLRELSRSVHQLEVQDVVQLELEPGEGERLLRRLHTRGHDPQERGVVLRLARDRADVHGGTRKGLRHTRQLSRLIGHENLELLHALPPQNVQ